jgi:hypothetical protein
MRGQCLEIIFSYLAILVRALRVDAIYPSLVEEDEEYNVVAEASQPMKDRHLLAISKILD